MGIRKKLRERAEMELHVMIEKLEKHALDICSDMPVEPKELCRLVCGGRTQALLTKVQGKMADRYESSLLARLDDELPADENF